MSVQLHKTWNPKYQRDERFYVVACDSCRRTFPQWAATRMAAMQAAVAGGWGYDDGEQFWCPDHSGATDAPL